MLEEKFSVLTIDYSVTYMRFTYAAFIVLR